MKTLNSIALLLSALPALASANTGQSKKELPKSWRDDLRLNTFGWVYGPALSQMGTARPSTSKGVPDTSAITVTQQLNLNAPTGLGDFRYTFINFLNWAPIARPDGTSFLSLGNPWLGAAGTHYDRNGTSFWTRYEASPALTEATRTKGHLMSVRAVQVLSFTLDKQKRWTLTPVLVPEHRFERGGSSNSIFFQPTLAYSMNDRLSMGVFMESFFVRKKGEALSNWSQAMQPTIALSPTVRFQNGAFLQPFLNFYTGRSPTLDTVHVGAFFGGRFF